MSDWVTGDVRADMGAHRLSARAWPEGRGLSLDDPPVTCGDAPHDVRCRLLRRDVVRIA